MQGEPLIWRSILIDASPKLPQYLRLSLLASQVTLRWAAENAGTTIKTKATPRKRRNAFNFMCLLL
jgi:hypothetical protein